MQVVRGIREMTKIAEEAACQGDPLILVPTMGFLHEGHLSLIRKAREFSARVVVSIFVNPLQFNSKEDLEKYPRNEQSDLGLLEKENVEFAFLPEGSEVYSTEPGIQISYPSLTQGKLCGASRSGHFEGVLHIVHNLFQWTKPSHAVFGLKDYQQYLVVNKMAEELHMGVKIVPAPLVREDDGLAMSSRNSRLPARSRSEALKLFHALQAGKELFHTGKSEREITDAMHSVLSPLKIDYAGIYHPQTLEPWTKEPEAVLAIAAWVEGVRLIDNMVIKYEL